MHQSNSILSCDGDWAQELEQARLCRPVSVYGKDRMTLRLRLLGEKSVLWNEKGASLTPFRAVFERRAPATLVLLDRLVTVGNYNTVRAADITEEVLALLRSAYVGDQQRTKLPNPLDPAHHGMSPKPA